MTSRGRTNRSPRHTPRGTLWRRRIQADYKQVCIASLRRGRTHPCVSKRRVNHPSLCTPVGFRAAHLTRVSLGPRGHVAISNIGAYEPKA